LPLLGYSVGGWHTLPCSHYGFADALISSASSCWPPGRARRATSWPP